MLPDRFQPPNCPRPMNRIEEVFTEASDLPASERGAYLDAACAGNPALRQRVEDLLHCHDGSDSLLAPPLAAVALEPLPVEEKPCDRIGRYKLLEQIGEGGGGVVWMAEQVEPVRRRVALKIIRLGMDTHEVVARFEAERQALALMDHPNIARVFDGGATAQGRPYFVMELVRGLPITRYCDEARLTPAQRLELFIAVCLAVQHAHQKGVIHRDLKPSNVLVTVNDGVPVPKVIDFGVAKATQGPLTDKTLFTAFQQFIGTPVYMSPEQADLSSVDIDTRSDIYSLGVLLYELLTGAPPFDPKKLAAGGVDEIRRVLREVEPARPSARLATLDEPVRTTLSHQRSLAVHELSVALRGDLDWIVMRCLEKDRARRYASVGALIADLRRHLAHEPVVARPPSATYRLQKFIRRHRLGVGAAAFVAVSVVLGAGLSTVSAIRASRAEREQSRLRVLAQQAQAREAALRQRAEAQGLAARRRAYAADMNLVQQALANENRGRALELLNRHRPGPGEVDLRGWEWRHLWLTCRSDAEEVLLEPNDNWVYSLAVSADGEWVAAGMHYRGEVIVLNLRTRETLRLVAGTSLVRVAFSPQAPVLAIGANGADQSRDLDIPGPASSSAENRVILWNLPLRRTLRVLPLAGTCTGLSFSAEGETLVAAEDSSTLRHLSTWQVASGVRLARFPLGPGGWSVRTAVDRTASRAAAAGARELLLVDPKSARNLGSIPTGERRTGLAFSPDGKRIASGPHSGSAPHIRWWDLESQRELPPLTGHQQWIANLFFTPDGRHLISSSSDHTLRLWDAATGEPLRTLRGHLTEVFCAAMLPDGRTLLSGAKDGSVYRWNLATAARKPAAGVIAPARSQSIRAWGFAGGGKSLALVLRTDGKDVLTQRHGPAFATEEPIMAFETFTWTLLDSHSPLLAGANSQGEVQVWDWANRTRVSSFPPRDDERDWVWIMGRFSADGTRVGAMFQHPKTDTARFREWNIATGGAPRTVEFPSVGPGDRAVLSPRLDFQIRAASPEGTLRRLDLWNGQIITLPPKVDVPSIGLACSADGRLLAVPSGRGNVRLFETATGRDVARLGGYIVGVHSAGFSADGSRLVVGSTSREGVTLYDWETLERLLTLGTNAGVLRFTGFSDDGNLLVSHEASQGGVRLYWWRAPSWAEIDAAK